MDETLRDHLINIIHTLIICNNNSICIVLYKYSSLKIVKKFDLTSLYEYLLIVVLYSSGGHYFCSRAIGGSLGGFFGSFENLLYPIEIGFLTNKRVTYQLRV